MILKRRCNRLRCFLIGCAVFAFANVGQTQLLTELTVDITQDADGLYTYLYTLENAAFSSQSANTFLLTTGKGADIVDIFGPNENWFAGHFPDPNRPSLQAAFQTGISDDGNECGVTDEFDLFPGNSTTFTITSTWGPDVKDYQLGRTAGAGLDCTFVGDIIFGDIESPAIPANPIVTATCDFDEDGDCDTRDIDNLAFTIIEGSNDPTYDLSDDGSVNSADLALFLKQVGSRNGDLDLDGTVAFADFLTLSSNFGMEAEWSGGDLTIDGTVGFPDFLVLSENFGQVGAGALSAVPEPASGGMALMLFACSSVVLRRRRRI